MLAGAVKIVSADGDVIVTDGGRFAVVFVVFSGRRSVQLYRFVL
jgi:hypothetical protein